MIKPSTRSFVPLRARSLLPLLALLLAVVAFPLRAADTSAMGKPDAAAAATPSPRESHDAAVVVFNRTVTVFRTSFLGVSAPERAKRTQALIEELLARGGEGKITVQREPQGNVVMFDGELALILVQDDVDRVRGETLDAKTRSAVNALAQIASETQESRDVDRLLRDAGAAAVATAVFAMLVWVSWRARRSLVTLLAGTLEKRTANLRVAGTPVLQAERLYHIARWLVRMLSWFLLAILTYYWLSYVLRRFPYTRAWGENLDGYLVAVVRRIGGGIVSAVPDLMIAVLIFAIAWGITRAVAPLFQRIESGSAVMGWLDSDTARPTRQLLSVGVWAFAVVMAYPYLPGAGSEAFKGVSLLVGLMATIGGSSVIGQAVSGVMLMYSRTVRVGEYVRINEYEGTVTQLGAFATRMRTGLGEEISLPNTLVLGTVTRNYSRAVNGEGYVVHTSVTIGYDTPWRQVEAMLVEAAQRTPSVLGPPAPRVFQTALSDFYVEYRLACHARASAAHARAEVLDRLHANIQDVFNEYGVQIMSPHYLGDPATAKVVPKEQWHAPPAPAPAAAPARARA